LIVELHHIGIQGDANTFFASYVSNTVENIRYVSVTVNFPKLVSVWNSPKDSF